MELTIEQALQQGVAAHKEGNLQEAERIYNAILQSQPAHADANHNLGVMAVSVNKVALALPLFKTALEANPKIEQFWLSYIDALIKENQLEGAQAVREQGRKLGLAGNKVDALFLQSKAPADEPAPSQAQLISLLEHYQSGRFSDAEKLALSITQKFPKHQSSWKVLGAIFKQTARISEALDANQKSITLSPQDSEAHYNLGNTLRELGRFDEAEESYRQATELKPDFAEAKHQLASLTEETTNSAPRAYVEKLFDGYAAKFDHSLVDNLEYKMPKMIVEIILENHPGGMLGSILDLGCGTGLTGLEIKKYCTNLEGIDLSKRMLDEATKKNTYDRLTYRDIVDYLSTENLNFDYFISTDVFIYVGDLSDVFRLIKSRNNLGGKLAFSTEHTDKNGFILGKSGRYSHSKPYIESLCEKYNYTVSHFEIVTLRKEKGIYLKGGLYLLDF